MGVDGAAILDDKTLRLERFEAEIVDSGRDRAFDLGGQQLLEGRVQDVLQLNGERQEPIEEGRDRRQFILDAVVVHQLQARRIFEALERAALDLAANEEDIELA